ncbi:sulfite oxidase-like oxidoreductase, partial [Acinetobacter baumannii]|nr:sulfite oxidase-like oxidoreductase [Acinetobacter baumannii]
MRRLARLTLLSLALACTSAASAHGVQPVTPVRALAIGGGVERALKLDADALRKRPASQFTEVRLTDKQGKTGTVRGIRLRDLLGEAGIVSRDHNTVKKLAIIATAADKYAVVFSW